MCPVLVEVEIDPMMEAPERALTCLPGSTDCVLCAVAGGIERGEWSIGQSGLALSRHIDREARLSVDGTRLDWFEAYSQAVLAVGEAIGVNTLEWDFADVVIFINDYGYYNRDKRKTVRALRRAARKAAANR